jgi:tetratricopeptide (TPR) repeat protein
MQGAAQSTQDGLRLLGEAKVLKENASSTEDVKKAVEKLRQALKVFEKAGDNQAMGRTLYSLGVVFADWSQYATAMEHYEKSLELSRKTGDVLCEAYTLVNMGNVFSNWGQYQKALECYEKSLELCRKTGNVLGEGETLNSLGIIYGTLGHDPKAVECFEKSLDLFRNIGDVRGEVYPLSNLGSVYEAWGQYPKAAENYEKSLELSRKTGSVPGESIALNHLGHLYEMWGQYQNAVRQYEKSLDLKRKTGDVRGEGRTLINLGNLYGEWGEYDKALASFQEGLELYVKVGAPAEWPRDLIGHLYLDKGDIRGAETFVKESSSSALSGRFHLVKSDHEHAKDHYERLRQSAEKTREAAGLFVAYTGLGLACEGLRDYLGASAHFQKAIDHTEELRAGLREAERAGFFNVQIGGFRRTAPYKGLARVLTRMNYNVEALRSSEYTKARVFAEGLSRRAEGSLFNVPKEIVTRDSELNEQLAALTKSLQKGYEKENRDIIAALEPQVKEAKDKLAVHVDMLRKQHPLFAATKYPQPVGLDQTAPKEGEWVLSYDVTDSGLLIYLTEGTNIIKCLFKPIASKELDSLVKKFMAPLVSELADSTLKEFEAKLKSFDFASGRELSKILLDDMLPDLPQGKPLIIVPDDCLAVLPFEMLVLNSGGQVNTDIKTDPVTGRRTVHPRVTGADFFGDRHPISYCQSITALTLARNHAKPPGSQKKMLVMAEPVFDLKDKRAQVVRDTGHLTAEEQQLYRELYNKMAGTRDSGGSGIYFGPLPLTGKLAEAIGKIYPGDCHIYTGLDASKQHFMDKIKPKLAEYNQVVFATHGYFGKDIPGIQEPVLVLTLVPPGTDGYLRMSEVIGLNLNADMVALTACQTGVGHRIFGEGTMGMGRAFQYAGAKSVLMSLWSVAEASSVGMVESFFKHMKAGKSKLEALKLARQEIRKAGSDHPFFWAPFILVGEAN